MTNSIVLKVRGNKIMWLENGNLLLKVAYADNSTAQMVKHNHNQFCFTNKGEADCGYCFNNLFHYNKIYFTNKTVKEWQSKGLVSTPYFAYNVEDGRWAEAGSYVNYFKVAAEVVYQYQDTYIQRYHKEKALEREAAQKKWYVHYDGVLSYGEFAYGVDSVYDDDAIFDTEAEMLDYIKINYPEWTELYAIQ